MQGRPRSLATMKTTFPAYLDGIFAGLGSKISNFVCHLVLNFIPPALEGQRLKCRQHHQPCPIIVGPLNQVDKSLFTIQPAGHGSRPDMQVRSAAHS